jgi:hypothetical protein
MKRCGKHGERWTACFGVDPGCQKCQAETVAGKCLVRFKPPVRRWGNWDLETCNAPLPCKAHPERPTT